MSPPTAPQPRSPRRRLSAKASGPPHGRPRAHTPAPTAPLALGAPASGLRPARGGAGGAAGLCRACAAGRGKWRRRVCAAAAGAWGRRWSLPPAPQVGAVDGRAGERGGGRERGREEGRTAGQRSAPRHIPLHPPTSSPPLPLASPGLPVGNPRRFPLAPHPRRRGRWPGLRRTAGGCWEGPP